MATWGTQTINILQDSYAGPVADAGIVEIDILPGGEGPASVIQQGGRRRKTASWDGWATKTDVDDLLDDYYGGTAKTFTAADGTSFLAVIQSISYRPTQLSGGTFYIYSISILEA